MTFKLWVIAEPAGDENGIPGGVTSHIVEFETKELAEIARKSVLDRDDSDHNFYTTAVPLYWLPTPAHQEPDA